MAQGRARPVGRARAERRRPAGGRTRAGTDGVRRPPATGTSTPLFATSPGFTATLVSLDDRKVASGRDFDAGGRLKDGDAADVVVLDEPAARGPGRPVGRCPVHRPAGRGAPVQLEAQGPVHDLDAPAGGRPQAGHDRPEGHAHRPEPVRAGLHHLHAHRLGGAGRIGGGHGPGPGPRALRRRVPARTVRGSTRTRSRTPRRPTRPSDRRATRGGRLAS